MDSAGMLLAEVPEDGSGHRASGRSSSWALSASCFVIRPTMLLFSLAAAAPLLVLPPGEDPNVWSAPSELAGVDLVDGDPRIELWDVGVEWEIRADGVLLVTVPEPTDPSGRERVAALARSLSRDVRFAVGTTPPAPTAPLAKPPGAPPSPKPPPVAPKPPKPHVDDAPRAAIVPAAMPRSAPSPPLPSLTAPPTSAKCHRSPKPA